MTTSSPPVIQRSPITSSSSPQQQQGAARSRRRLNTTLAPHQMHSKRSRVDWSNSSSEEGTENEDDIPTQVTTTPQDDMSTYISTTQYTSQPEEPGYSSNEEENNLSQSLLEHAGDELSILLQDTPTNHTEQRIDLNTESKTAVSQESLNLDDIARLDAMEREALNRPTVISPLNNTPSLLCENLVRELDHLEKSALQIQRLSNPAAPPPALNRQPVSSPPSSNNTPSLLCENLAQELDHLEKSALQIQRLSTSPAAPPALNRQPVSSPPSTNNTPSSVLCENLAQELDHLEKSALKIQRLSNPAPPPPHQRSSPLLTCTPQEDSFDAGGDELLAGLDMPGAEDSGFPEDDDELLAQVDLMEQQQHSDPALELLDGVDLDESFGEPDEPYQDCFHDENNERDGDDIQQCS